jgi:hypothetical protein
MCNPCIGLTTNPDRNEVICGQCATVHAIPADGFTVCGPLLKLLQSGPCEVYRGERVRALTTKLKMLKTEFEVETQRHTNGPTTIKSHCDLVRNELARHVEAVQTRLRECNEELLERIGQYETECVGIFEQFAHSTQNGFDAMRGEFEQFSAEARAYLEEFELDKERLDVSISAAEEFAARLRVEKLKLSSALFNNKLLELNKNFAYREFDESFFASLSYKTINEFGDVSSLKKSKLCFFSVFLGSVV